ncbi:hypothetical protein ACIBTV_27905 [Micromonospora sp. NPDC049366]|uniref:hypothetical protein n=1 Tax=Micromonospora sp. NPDC049366 TaxID=3364271 RepID=UPI00379C7002
MAMTQQKLVRHVVSLAAAGLAAANISGCSKPESSEPSNKPNSKYQEFDGYLAEYNSAIKSMTLPRNAMWGAAPTRPPEPMLYARGVGSTRAELTWYCAWEKEWLAALAENPRSERHDYAIEQLERVRTLQLYQVALDEEGRTQIERSLAEARRGNPAAVEADVATNC